MRTFFLFLSVLLVQKGQASTSADTSKPKYNIFFKNTVGDTVHRSSKTESNWIIDISASNVDADIFKDYTIEIAVSEKSTLPPNHYLILTTASGKKIKDLPKADPIRIAIRKEDETFKQTKPLVLILKLSIKKKDQGKEVTDEEDHNEGKNKTEVTLTIMPADEKLHTYNYLGYVGTNFDLVDGVQAKNLFFATNIFIPENRKWGFNISLYGNRTMTKTDTAKQTSFESKIIKINNDSIARYFDTAMKVTSRVSDNIGASFNPLIPLKFLSDGPLKIYYAPQFEFVWRRTTIENSYQNSRTNKIDSSKSRLPANTAFPIVTPLSSKVDFNVYDVYLGFAAFMLRYETDDISIRLSSSVGLNLNYVPLGALSNTNTVGTVNAVYPTYLKQKRVFYFGRLWITEPYTGLTLGAEVSNYFGSTEVNGLKMSKGLPNYNVTLSKAFDLKNLAAIVRPLTNR